MPARAGSICLACHHCASSRRKHMPGLSSLCQLAPEACLACVREAVCMAELLWCSADAYHVAPGHTMLHQVTPCCTRSHHVCTRSHHVAPGHTMLHQVTRSTGVSCWACPAREAGRCVWGSVCLCACAPAACRGHLWQALAGAPRVRAHTCEWVCGSSFVRARMLACCLLLAGALCSRTLPLACLLMLGLAGALRGNFAC